MAIVDEIAAKEALQVQQKQTLQQVNEVSKDSSFSPLHVLSVTHRDKVLVKIRCLQARRLHTLVFFCGSGGYARSKFKFRKAIFRSCNVGKGTHFSCLREETSEYFDCRGRVARRIFELYTAV